MDRKHFLLLLPLLLFYVLIVALFSTNKLQGDEIGYVEFAYRLSQGYYLPGDRISLWWGPGYPIVLAPFILLKLPWLTAKLLNTLFLFGSILYLYRALSIYIPRHHALIFTFSFGLYPPLVREVHLLLTESLVFFLVCGFIFHFCKSASRHNNIHASLHLIAASVYLASLALTKVFFGYVIFISSLLFLLLHVWKRRLELKMTSYIYVLALIWCLPYLLYTYFLTGKIFYWGTSGGMSLYWMSTPYENEWGSWFSLENVESLPELAEHRRFFDKIAVFSEVEGDSAFRRQAICNILQYPLKYFTNWLANIGRLLFSYPFSYSQHTLSTYFYIVPNMFIVVLFTFSFYPIIVQWKIIPHELYALFFFFSLTFGGTSLLSAYARQFWPIVPFLFLWIAFAYIRLLKIEIRKESGSIST